MSEALSRVSRIVSRLAPYEISAPVSASAGTIDIEQLNRLHMDIAIHVLIALPLVD